MPVNNHDKTLFALRRVLDQAEEGRLDAVATLSKDAVRRRPDKAADSGHRQHFAVDADRILHSLAYTRYIDKTQVFSLIKNDQITHRVLHVQLVSKIARTIGRLLGANEDLIEAIALGHDIGHPPFGHDGEKFLSAQCLSHGIGHFLHNVQSVRFLEVIEREGRGWNLSLQVLDGILCHDGEVHDPELTPDRDKTLADFDAEAAGKIADPKLRLTPMTIEGCIVRLADTISYIGRDIEDAVRLGLIVWDDIPPSCARVLGKTNGTIVYRLVEDLVAHSRGRGRVAFSPEKSQALKNLKAFNYERIYNNPAIKPHLDKVQNMFAVLFEAFMDDYQKGRYDSAIFVDFIAGMDQAYLSGNRPAEVVRDFLSGLTDERFLSLFEDRVLPRVLPRRFLENHKRFSP